jgi:tRNA(Ile)-lysidine synthase
MDNLKFLDILESKCAAAGEQPIVVGVSGGPDSLTLLSLLNQTKFPLIVAHFDHALRPESSTEVAFVRRNAASLNLPFRHERQDVRAHAEDQKLSIEEAARELRYSFLFRLAEETDAQAIAVGHTADDQAETLLMHLLRGTGLSGLRGMAYRTLPNPWSQSVPLIRPLLSFRREEILAYCTKMELDPIDDPSNLDSSFTRNRIRHELLPKLEEYNPQIKEHLLQSADLLSEDFQLIEALSNMVWGKILREIDHHKLAIDRQIFLRQPLALQRMLLRRVFQTLRPEARNLDYAAIERAIKIVAQPLNKQHDWLASLYIFVEDNLIWAADWENDLPVIGPQLKQKDNQPLGIPGVVDLDGGWHLEAEEMQLLASHKELQDTNPYEAFLDMSKVKKELTLRTRKPGDRFRPLGMKSGSMKLSDFMINVKIPQRARAAWPLLSHDKEILWVPGYRLAQPFRLTESSRNAIHLRLTHHPA